MHGRWQDCSREHFKAVTWLHGMWRKHTHTEGSKWNTWFSGTMRTASASTTSPRWEWILLWRFSSGLTQRWYGSNYGILQGRSGSPWWHHCTMRRLCLCYVWCYQCHYLQQQPKMETGPGQPSYTAKWRAGVLPALGQQEWSLPLGSELGPDWLVQ